MRTETAISLVVVVMEALNHRKACLGGVERDLPDELLAAAFAQLEADGEETTEAREFLAGYGVDIPSVVKIPYRRRANNQKSADVEQLIRDLLARGLSKSAVAKQLKVNRRVVIRVAREAESAQSAQIGQKGPITDSQMI
jgi:DNA invertase Pin-like site-specific DNA recombinase